MKKLKKDKKSVGWKIVIGVIVVGVLAMGIHHIVALWQWTGYIDDNANATAWTLTGLGWYSEVSVSDDGRWYQIPEVRVKFPFFDTFENADKVFMGRPLRYNTNYFLPESGENGWLVALTYDVMDNSFVETFPEGTCMAPFVIEYNFYYGDEEDISEWQMREYKTVAKVLLADGRLVSLRQRTSGESCDRLFLDGNNRGEALRGWFSQLRSY